MESGPKKVCSQYADIIRNAIERSMEFSPDGKVTKDTVEWTRGMVETDQKHHERMDAAWEELIKAQEQYNLSKNRP